MLDADLPIPLIYFKNGSFSSISASLETTQLHPDGQELKQHLGLNRLNFAHHGLIPHLKPRIVSSDLQTHRSDKKAVDDKKIFG